MAPRPRSREGLSASRVRRTAPTCGTDWKLDRRPTPSVRTDDARRRFVNPYYAGRHLSIGPALRNCSLVTLLAFW